MTSHAPKNSRGKPAGKRSLYWVAGILALCGIGACNLGWLGYRAIKNGLGADDLSATVASYKLAGLPWTAADIAAGPSVPENQNAALLLRKAIGDLDSERFAHDSHGLVNDADNAHVTSLRARLLSYKVCLSELEDASSKPYLDWGPHWDVDIPPTVQVKALCNLMDLRAELEAADGEPERSLRDLATVRRVALLCGTQPSGVDQLGRMMLENNMLASAQRCAATWVDKPANVHKLLKFLDGPIPTPDLARALRTEALETLESARRLTLQELIKGNSRERPTEGELRSGIPEDPVARGVMATTLRFWIEAAPLIAMEKSMPLSLEQQLEVMRLRNSNKAPIAGALADDALSQARLVVCTFLINQGTRKVTSAFAESVLYHSRFKKWPATVEEIPEGPWTDPVTNNQLVIKALGTQFRICGSGPTGRDYGIVSRGEVSELEVQEYGYDLVAAYPPIPGDR